MPKQESELVWRSRLRKWIKREGGPRFSVVLSLYPLSEPRTERRAEFHPRSEPVAVLSC